MDKNTKPKSLYPHIPGTTAADSLRRLELANQSKYPRSWLTETDLLIEQAIRTEPEFPIYPRGSAPIWDKNDKNPPGKLELLPLTPHTSPKPFSFFL